MSGHVPGEARRPSTSAPAQDVAAEERPRFGINNLINRMSGAQGGERQPQMARQQPNVTRPEPQAELSEEQERIEIPAFLRRQAN
jgi:cell division protein FtsZ